MWRPVYKQRCLNCKKNMVLIRYPKQRAICEHCQSSSISTPITDPKFQKLFNIDPVLYQQSSFLRDIRYQYGRFENLSERQIQTFERVVKELKQKMDGPAQEEKARGEKPGLKAGAAVFPNAFHPSTRSRRRSLSPLSYNKSH